MRQEAAEEKADQKADRHAVQAARAVSLLFPGENTGPRREAAVEEEADRHAVQAAREAARAAEGANMIAYYCRHCRKRKHEPASRGCRRQVPPKPRSSDAARRESVLKQNADTNQRDVADNDAANSLLLLHMHVRPERLALQSARTDE